MSADRNILNIRIIISRKMKIPKARDKRNKKEKPKAGEITKEIDVFHYLPPDKIDDIIKGHKKRQPWKESEISLRRLVIIDLVGQGLSYRRLIEELMNRWELSKTTCEEFYYDAMSAVKEDAKAAVPFLRETINERLENTMEEAKENGDRQNFLKALDMFSKINGCYKEDTDKDKDITIHFDFK